MQVQVGAELKTFQADLAVINALATRASGREGGGADAVPGGSAGLIAALGGEGKDRALKTWARAFRGTIELLNDFDDQLRANPALIDGPDLEKALDASRRVLDSLRLAVSSAA